jgi:hypothetical protein
MPSKRISGVLSGVAGEYLVAGELSRRGYIASITLRNTKGVDILASNADASKTVGIQVKTNQGKQKFWLLNQKAETYHADNLFYVFVNLNNGSAPDYFIVPSKKVADFARKYHQEWLKTPGRKGQAHKDNPLREFRDIKKEYLNKWDLLGLL